MIRRLGLSALTAVAAVAGLGCREPSISGDGDGDSGDSTTQIGDESGESGDPFACEPWADPPRALGMGETSPLTFVDASAELGLLDTAYFEGDWPPGCDPGAEGWVGTPCKMELQGGGAAIGDFDDDGWPDIDLTRLGARDQRRRANDRDQAMAQRDRLAQRLAGRRARGPRRQPASARRPGRAAPRARRTHASPGDRRRQPLSRPRRVSGALWPGPDREPRSQNCASPGQAGPRPR